MSQPVVLRENTTVYDAICTIFLECSTLFIINEDNDFVGVCFKKRFIKSFNDWSRYSYSTYQCKYDTYA